MTIKMLLLSITVIGCISINSKGKHITNGMVVSNLTICVLATSFYLHKYKRFVLDCGIFYSFHVWEKWCVIIVLAIINCLQKKKKTGRQSRRQSPAQIIIFPTEVLTRLHFSLVMNYEISLPITIGA